MKNKEKYMTEIIDTYLDGKTIAVKADRKPCICQKTRCKECIFYDGTNPYCRDRIGYVRGQTRNILRDL